MHPDLSLRPGLSAPLVPATGGFAPVRVDFRWTPGTARVDLPPQWCRMDTSARLVAMVSSDSRRAQGPAQPASQPGTSSQAASWPVPDDPSTSAAAATSALSAAWARAHVAADAVARAGTSAAASSAATAAAPAAVADGTNATAEFFHFFRAQHPGVQAHIGLVPHELHMGRAPYIDLRGVARVPGGGISETETVWDSCLVLANIPSQPVPPEHDLPSVLYFDVCLAGSPPTSGSLEPYVAQRQSDLATVTALMSALDKSPSFRKLIHHAIAQRNLPLAAPERWSIVLLSPIAERDGLPLYEAIGIRRTTRVMTLPLRDARPLGNHFYVFKGGGLMPMNPVCYAVRAMVAALTGANPLNPAPWMGADGRIDPQCVVALGAGERGAVDYLSQRILAELGLDYQWISPLAFAEGVLATPPGDTPPVWRLTDTLRQAFDAIGGVGAVEQYVAWQDTYLRQQYP
ncbi:hypothetical protein [Bordetella bronchialis]|uniref:Uncharacterized protein n=1 Tax=Bordetella bronchialis TaxID=463025 RepID=A0A193FTP3_9BORD|nr:hypothetical protein [Bordetella bronchialis]ANN70698.1 hypothetical protein BAU08_04565 [Bordetella bronchialis]